MSRSLCLGRGPRANLSLFGMLVALPYDSLNAMNEPAYREAIAHYIKENAKPPDKFSHQPRLYRLARQLAEGKAYDDDVVYAAAWMHDLGVFVGHRPEDPAALASWDNVAYALQQAP